MNQLLVDTHRKDNIKYLKARDYYFNQARNIDKVRNFLIILPTLILILVFLGMAALSMWNKYIGIPNYDVIMGWYDQYVDPILGILPIGIFVITFVMEDRISKKKEISNMLREEYDNRVFQMKRNLFAYDYEQVEQYLEKANKISDYYKYEVWYEEIFCNDLNRNTICSQMDNVIYTYFIYEDALKCYRRRLAVIVVAMFVIGILTYPIISPLMVFLTVFELIQVTFEQITVSKELIAANKGLKELIMRDDLYEQIVSDFPYYIRCLQDCVITNRNNGLFVPKRIRDKYLKEDSAFYQELNQVKARYLDAETTCMPESAEDLEVLSWDESKTVTVKELQDRLLTIMEDVHRVFEENGIRYLLDGGTLIGAVRKSGKGIKPVEEDCLDMQNGGFLFWDDDVDIALPLAQVAKAKQILQEKLGHKYVIQDYENEQYYSPRLSVFRIREQNEKSSVAEKDSELWEKYGSKGIFIDVYAYSPILFNMFADKVFRRLLMHPLNVKMSAVERKWKYGGNPEKMEKVFLKQKKRYLNVVAWYEKHAKNEKYYSYTPYFINDLKKAGPYIPKDALYGMANTAMFEGRKMPVPSKPEIVLKAMYGKNWYKSPYHYKEDLMEEHKNNWYNKAEFKCSVLKHIKYLDLK